MKPRTELTDRQRSVVEAILAWIKEHWFPPTIRELGRLLGPGFRGPRRGCAA